MSALADGSAGLPARIALDLTLLDSLYGNLDAFDGFVRAAASAGTLGLQRNQTRFSSFYTSSAGTADNNRAMAARASRWLAAANASALLFDGDGDDELTRDEAARYPLIFKFSPHTHDDTARLYFSRLLAWEVYV